MPNDETWHRRAEMPLPENATRVEFELAGLRYRGFFVNARFHNVTGDGRQGSISVGIEQISAWRALPQPPKPELPEFVKAFLQKWGHINDGLFWTDISEALFDDTKFPHLAVVESEHAVTTSVACLRREVELQTVENRRLREERKAEREAVEKILDQAAIGSRTAWVPRLQESIGSYRALIQTHDHPPIEGATTGTDSQ